MHRAGGSIGFRQLLCYTEGGESVPQGRDIFAAVGGKTAVC